MGGRSCLRTRRAGESQSNGTVEEASKNVREFVRVLREHVQDKAEVELGRIGRDRALDGALGGDDGVEVLGWKDGAHGV